jgi:hypothetical protein
MGERIDAEIEQQRRKNWTHTCYSIVLRSLAERNPEITLPPGQACPLCGKAQR